MSGETLIDDGDGAKQDETPAETPAEPQGGAAQDASGQAPAAPEGLAPIIVKKITIEEGGHHGGAWKVAYADFVTAMMAFFLLLWLLGATTEDQRKGLADYFTPTLISYRENSAGADGMLGGSSITEVDNYPNRQGQTGNNAITVPKGARGGPDIGEMGPAQQRAAEQAEQTRQELKEKIEAKLKAKAALAKLVEQVRVVRSPQGVRIDLVDDADFSMFALGTTVLVPEAEQIVSIVADAVSGTAKPLVVRGHTDALPWRPGVRANNWSLSSGRAEATRQALMRSGISEGRFARIEGVAAREPLIDEDPTDPRNRRVSIILEDALPTR